ncbi:hypothetical protein, partial [Aurantimonas sp. C2-4-R8]|nr:hypothetical protein [Aurantimonas sp. C2-4-R8]
PASRREPVLSSYRGTATSFHDYGWLRRNSLPRLPHVITNCHRNIEDLINKIPIGNDYLYLYVDATGIAILF